MHAGAKRKASLKTLPNTVYFVCKSCGKTDQEASLSSSTASSKAVSPLPKRNRKLKTMHRGSAQRASDSESWEFNNESWTNEVEPLFVDLMYDEVLKGNIYTTSFSPLVWSDIRSSLFDLTGVVFEVKQLKRKLNKLKETWKKYQELMLLDTEIGWNPESNMPQAEPLIWEGLAKSNATAAELRYTSFPHYLKLDVVFTGRAAIGANARASTQKVTQERPYPEEKAAIGSPPATTPSESNARTILSGGKRKAPYLSVLEKLVDTIDFANKAIAEKAAKKETYSIERVIDLLNTFDHLDSSTYNCALEHFQQEGHRRTFMYLTRERQIDYIQYILRKSLN